MEDQNDISLCMIVRDNEPTIRPSLESIMPWVGEIVVVDTGSTDATPEIAKSLGARVFHKEWTDDFSAARNFSIDQARGKWIFWMDSDDTCPPVCGEKLQQLGRTRHPENVLGFVMQVRCPGDSDGGAEEFTVVDHVKMFRNRPDLRFEGPIHEQIMMPIRRLGGEIQWTDIYVVHSGSDQSPESQKRKIERDLRILRKDLAARPDHPFVLFNFAMTYAEAGQFGEALGWVERCLAASEPHESHVRKAYAYLANCHFQLGHPNEAMAACKSGRQWYPDDPELLFREAMILHEIRELDESIARYREILQLPHRDVFHSTDPGIRSFKCRFNLGVALRDAGKLDEAEVQWRTVLRERPGYGPACRAMVELLLANSRPTTAVVEAEKLRSVPTAEADGLVLSARVYEHQKELEKAGNLLEDAIERFPENERILEENCRFHFTHSSFETAKHAIESLLVKNPANAAAHYNLAALYLRENDFDQALASARRSLHLRPSSDATLSLCEAATRSRDQAFELKRLNASQNPIDSSSSISVNFYGDVVDAVSAARILSVYAANGFAVEVQCSEDQIPLFKAAGARIITKARDDWELMQSPYRPEMDNLKEWQINIAGWNLSGPPLPQIGTTDELWHQFRLTSLPIGQYVAGKIRKNIADWLGEFRRPIVLVDDGSLVASNVIAIGDLAPFREQLAQRTDGTVILTGPADRDAEVMPSRVVRLIHSGKPTSIESLIAILEHSDLVVAADSALAHLAALANTPSVAIWTDQHPAQVAFPSNRQVNLVVETTDKPANRRWRVPWNMIDVDRTALTTTRLVDHCCALLSQPRYLADEQLAADVQLQHWIQTLCHEDGEPVRDRDNSFDILFQEIRRRFNRPTIIETGTIRAPDDWAGAGFFTYLAGAYALYCGGIVHSVDINPTICEFARAACSPFGESVKIHCKDSLAFLNSFAAPIDVLYCDSLDTYERGFEQHTLNEIVAAFPKLHDKSLVVFDDSPTIDGQISGKGKLAVPWLLERGWRIRFAGYQVILANNK